MDDDSTPDADTPSDDARLCLVAIRTDTFERCRAGFYPSPQSYDRTTAAFEYLAFYRTAPVSVGTHYARVTDKIVQHCGESGPMDEADWAATIDPFSDTDAVVVFELDDLVALADPIENDTTGVRGAWYCSLGDLRNARSLSELSRAGESS